MDIEEATETFINIWQDIFMNTTLDKLARGKALEIAMKAILKQKNMENQKLCVQDLEDEACKVYVLVYQSDMY